MSRRLYIATLGCQMNVLDSELVAAGLVERGYELVSSPRAADVILFNTCSVRQHAEDKVYSALGRLKHVKDGRRPRTIIGVLGCMAQKDGAAILKRAPHVDLVVGPSRLGRLAELIEAVEGGAGPLVEISPERVGRTRDEAKRAFAPFNPIRAASVRPSAHQAMVRILFGCDQFCAYCIVPKVRGPEQSRAPSEIEAEVRGLAAQAIEHGVALEVTLIGQTVNSYRHDEGGRTWRLADLLARLDPIPGLARLKFVTNCPRHMSDDLLAAVRDLPRVSPYLHVPAQSGSDAVLGRMKRGYTSGQYREMLGRIRAAVPEVAITSDFIVGFCGETEDDFQATMNLVREARFKNSFIFKYSPRPGTAAAAWEDDVPEAVKRRRNNALLSLQNAISEEDNRCFVGRTVEILVEGPSKLGRKAAAPGAACQLVGRTTCDRIVVFDGSPEFVGRILPVRIETATALTLFGRMGEGIRRSGGSWADAGGQLDEWLEQVAEDRARDRAEPSP